MKFLLNVTIACCLLLVAGVYQGLATKEKRSRSSGSRGVTTTPQPPSQRTTASGRPATTPILSTVKTSSTTIITVLPMTLFYTYPKSNADPTTDLVHQTTESVGQDSTAQELIDRSTSGSESSTTTIEPSKDLRSAMITVGVVFGAVMLVLVVTTLLVAIWITAAASGRRTNRGPGPDKERGVDNPSYSPVMPTTENGPSTTSTPASKHCVYHELERPQRAHVYEDVDGTDGSSVTDESSASTQSSSCPNELPAQPVTTSRQVQHEYELVAEVPGNKTGGYDHLAATKQNRLSSTSSEGKRFSIVDSKPLGMNYDSLEPAGSKEQQYASLETPGYAVLKPHVKVCDNRNSTNLNGTPNQEYSKLVRY